MTATTKSLRFTAALVGALAAGGCNTLDVGDLNNPGLDELNTSPTPVAINTVATGLLVGLRNNMAEPNGYIVLLGMMGREGFNLNTNSDPRYMAEMIAGPLDPGSGAFGANTWPQRYANIRNATTLLNTVGGVSDNLMTATQKEGIRGFAKTIQAIEFLRIIVTRDAFGAVIDVDRSPTGEPGAIASRAEVYARIVALLEEGRTHLLAAGSSFSFPLGDGFAGFNTPASFLKVNRAFRARVAVYLNDWNAALTALGQSFLDTGASLGLGAYHTYTTGSGDLTNNILRGTPVIRANPVLLTAAQLRGNGQIDLRASSKIATGSAATGASGATTITSNQDFTVYPTNTTPVAIIRNEELILLRAEANLGLNNIAQALVDINFIRNNAGGLPNYTGLQTAALVLDELLYNKRYSLLWEGGHSWIDFRHYNKLTSLPRMTANGKFFPAMPFPNNECLVRSNAASLAGCAPVPGI